MRKSGRYVKENLNVNVLQWTVEVICKLRGTTNQKVETEKEFEVVKLMETKD